MTNIKRFEDLEIWKDAREINKFVFEITKNQIFSRDFKFRDQIRASSGSIMDNIAEGFERGGNMELIQFLSISKGSCGETRSQVYKASDYDYIDKSTMEKLVNITANLSVKISNLIEYLKNSDFKGSKYH